MMQSAKSSGHDDLANLWDMSDDSHGRAPRRINFRSPIVLIALAAISVIGGLFIVKMLSGDSDSAGIGTSSEGWSLTSSSSGWTVKGSQVRYQGGSKPSDGAKSGATDKGGRSVVALFDSDKISDVVTIIDSPARVAGIVFRYEDAQNYYRLVVSPELSVVVVQKITDGAAENVKSQLRKVNAAPIKLEVSTADGRALARVDGAELWTSDVSPQRSLGRVGLTAVGTSDERFVSVEISTET